MRDIIKRVKMIGKSILQSFKKIFINKYFLLLLGILILSAILRFYNYPNRWGLAADQARDVLLVRESLRLHTLPLIGPFSASGPFVFGPFWYWIFALPIGLFPHIVLAPWIFETLLHVGIVLVMYFVGRELLDENFGLLVSFFTAISNSEIKLSTNIIMSGLVAVFSVCIIYCFIKYLKCKSIGFIILYSFLIGIAINTHFEAVPLTLLLIFGIIFGRRKASHIASSIFFFLAPFTPLFIFNYLSHGYEAANIFNLHQKSFGYGVLAPVLRKWLDFTIYFFPNIWGNTIGGVYLVAVVLIFALIFTAFFAIKQKKMSKEMEILFTVFVLMIVIIGFYSGTGTLFQALMSSTFPFILIFSAWTCYSIFKKNKLLGIILLCSIAYFTLVQDINLIKNSTNIASADAVFWEKNLIQKLPNQKFEVYTYTAANKDKSLPLSMFLDVNNKISDNGYQIGVAYFGAAVNHPVLIEGPIGPPSLRIYNLQGYPNKQIEKEGFIPVNPSEIYKSVEDWWK